MPAKDSLQIVCAEGEGQKVEFKAALSGIAREMAAFANASGGSIFLGVSDAGKIVGVADSNRLRSQIQDIANKCDPRIPIRLASHRQVVEIIVPEGVDKPYRCSEGFFLRIGPNSQQLNRDEIFHFAIKTEKVRFDEQFEEKADAKTCLHTERINAFLRKRGLPEKTASADLLINLGIAQKQKNRLLLTRAAILFFGREPQRFFPEACVTCALYADETRAGVLDRIDAIGTLEEQFEAASGFIRRNLRVGYRIEKAGPREEIPEIPEPVFREALLNAVTHRDYFADALRIYVHMHPQRMEIDSPGGLPYGLSMAELGTRAAPRNRLLADLFYRTGYVERLGSGIYRMRAAMAAAHLPPPRFSSTEHAFRVEIFSSFEAAGLMPEEARICQWLSAQGKASIIQLMDFFNLPKTSMHRRISKLVEDGWIVSHGSGRGTYYIVGDGSSSEGGTKVER